MWLAAYLGVGVVLMAGLALLDVRRGQRVGGGLRDEPGLMVVLLLLLATLWPIALIGMAQEWWEDR